jgi:hypothetical protein
MDFGDLGRGEAPEDIGEIVLGVEAIERSSAGL